MTMEAMNTLLHEHLSVEHFGPSQRRLRVAVVTETYPPEVNGVALTIERMIRGLQARQHDIQLVRPRQAHPNTSTQDSGLEQVLTRGFPIPRYPHLRMGLPAKRALLLLWSRRRPDIVHIATEGPLGWSALQAARKLLIPVSTDFRTNFHAYSQHYGIGWLKKPIAAYLKKFHNGAACTMVPTVELQQELKGLGFERLEVVARGIDTDLFTPQRRSEALRAQWGAGPDDIVILSVGRLAPEKNLSLLVRAYKAMQQVQARTQLVVVGDGPLTTMLKEQCPDAVFAGMRRGEDLATHYASADVFIFPSLTETYGNVTPEAMASGLAVLAFDYAAAAELIQHGHNGLLVPFGDEEAFIRRAQDLAASRPTQQALQTQARQHTLQHDWSRIVEQVEHLWTQRLLVTESQPV